MGEGVVTEDDGKRWRLTLRPGLKFHDGTPVLARDCVASIDRWAKRDSFGQALIERTEEMTAPDDRTIVFRLKRPFPLLPDALGKMYPRVPVIMPERLARTDPFRQVGEVVGSGPYRFKPDERVAGARIVYERFADYVPRGDGTAEGTAGPKVAHFDRIEWHIIPDANTQMAALQSDRVAWRSGPSARARPMRAMRAGRRPPSRAISSVRGARSPRRAIAASRWWSCSRPTSPTCARSAR